MPNWADGIDGMGMGLNKVDVSIDMVGLIPYGGFK
jgi:hypothetical protein